jgi:pimeloyl-ACP methyl ester carboxylesterase
MTGLPLVLLPGTLCDERIWAGVLSLMPNVPEVIMPQYPVGGTMADVIETLRKDLPDRFALAGFSLGGLAALELIRQAPESVDRLALIASHALIDTPDGIESRIRMVEQGREQGLEALVDDKFVPFGLTMSHPNYSANAALIRSMAASSCLSAFESQTEMALTRTDQHKTLTEFNRPILLLASSNDLLCIKEKPLLAEAATRNGQLVWIDDSGHYITLEQPQKVAQQLHNWLGDEI